MTAVTVGLVEESEHDSVLALLEHHRLPTDGLADAWSTTLVARAAGAVVGSAALELYDDGALLRSVAVADGYRDHGVGHDLTDAAVRLASERRAPDIYLLTTAAERFFPKFGFERIPREDVPVAVRTSVEFTSACPASAVVMRNHL